MKRKILLVIFDLDGTLVNAYKAVAESLNYSMKKSGFPLIDADTIKRSVGWGDRHLIEGFVGEERAQSVLEIYRKHHKASLKNGTRFLPGAFNILKWLRKEGCLLAIASNRPTRFSKIILRCLNIDRYFDIVLCADKLRRPKPYPDILLEILRRKKLNKGQAVYVGDMVIDAQTGRRAGVTTVIVTTGSSTPAEVRKEKPFAIIPNISRLRKIIQKLNQP